ncbi:hypothetical protein Riv7116_5512 [Rivularia sp. PCC 7116]|nr:hypothetical protein Riv7116_5512 [Rivularia sp. PCC 7116]
MHSTLTESLDVLLPNLEPTLATPDAVLGLKALVGNLAPILRGGFECRLNVNAPEVDLQQCIVGSESELVLLRELIATATSEGGESAHPGWFRLNDFLTEWSSSLSPLHNSITEIWLEFDIDKSYPINLITCKSGNTPPALKGTLPLSRGGLLPDAMITNHPDLISSASLPIPAIFFGLQQDVSPAVETYPIATKSLDLLLGDSGWCEWKEKLYRCFKSCPDRVFISHIGAMLSRNAPALRVNVKRLQPQLLIPYLQKIGWQHETNELEALMKQLFGLVDRITVCLDVGKQIYPQIGLECIFLNQPDSESRWNTFFNYLVEQGLCEPQKRDALLKWSGFTNPINAQAPWPNNLIVDSLLQPRERFSVFERRLSHIKISWRKQGQLSAKAYLWFEHQWLSGKI